MAYKDFAATEARGMWSPPNGAAPQMLPDQWKNNPGDELRYDLPDKTDDELIALGWKKEVLPSYATLGAAFFRNDYVWNSETRVFDAVEREDHEKEKAVGYINFWNALLYTDVYTSMKTAASTSLAANTLLTEFIALIDDAKRNNSDRVKIQESITGILAALTLSAEELAELQETFDSTGMSNIFTLA